MSTSLRNSIVFITGASSGIGAATARAFAAEGARVLQCARRVQDLKDAEALLRKAGAGDVHSFELDVRDRNAVEAAIGSLPQDWTEVDVLVNNAGLSRGLAKIYEDDPQNWEEMIDTNVKGLLYVSRAVVPGMVQRGRGHVINLGSTAGHMTYPNGSVYCATKAAEKAISEGYKLDLLGTPVRVTSIDPGMVETNFALTRFRGDAERAANVYKGYKPLKPEDVAETIVWAATRPAHVNIHTVVMTTIDQANSVSFSKREGRT